MNEMSTTVHVYISRGEEVYAKVYAFTDEELQRENSIILPALQALASMVYIKSKELAGLIPPVIQEQAFEKEQADG